MDDSGSVRAGAPEPRQIKARFSWLVLFLITTAALTLIAVHAPPVAKKLGLFAIAYGLVAGGIAAWLAALLDLRQTAKWPWPAPVFAIVLFGGIGMALEAHRLERVAERQALLADPKRAALIRLQEMAQSSGDAASQKEAAEMWHTVGGGGPSFRDYLERRMTALGPRTQRWAVTIWIVEVLLGAFAGAWMFVRLAGQRPLTAKASDRRGRSLHEAGDSSSDAVPAGLDGGVPPAKLEE